VKARLVPEVRLRGYEVVAQAVAEGAGHAARRALKHTASPSRDRLEELIEHEVMLALDAVLDFGGSR